MTHDISRETLSRIDKLLMDQRATRPDDSRQRRRLHGLGIVIGQDVKDCYALQLALLTAVNLGAKCFGGRVAVHASADVWLARCSVPIAMDATLADAVVTLGGTPIAGSLVGGKARHLILGDAPTAEGALRMTFDGWRVAVGPVEDLPRMGERAYCPLASIAAAALAVSEVFSEFAGLRITAARQVVTLSLWRPDLTLDRLETLGEPINELPTAIGVFGLGHLGQAYLWALAALPYSSPGKVTLQLCDDDTVEPVNVETGALLTPSAVTHQKTRVVAEWLEVRGFQTRLLERRIDCDFRRHENDPVLALSGFDDNRARQWLANSGFTKILDSGLGGEAANFDTIAYRAWPNRRKAADLWPIESDDERVAREERRRRMIQTNLAYQEVETDECGRLLLAGASVAVPFVGAVSACVVLAELLKSANGGPVFAELKLRLCALGVSRPAGLLAEAAAAPIRGLKMQSSNWSQ